MYAGILNHIGELLQTAGLYSQLLPDVQAPQPISKAEPRHPAEEIYSDHLYRSHSPLLSIRNIKLMVMDEDWNLDEK